MAISINNPSTAAAGSSKTFISISFGGMNTNFNTGGSVNIGPATVQYTVASGKTFNGYITGHFSINGASNYGAGSANEIYPISLPAGTTVSNVRNSSPAGGFLWGYEE